MGPPIFLSNWPLPFPWRQNKHWNIPSVLLELGGGLLLSPPFLFVIAINIMFIICLCARASLWAITISSQQSWYPHSLCSDSIKYCHSLCSLSMQFWNIIMLIIIPIESPSLPSPLLLSAAGGASAAWIPGFSSVSDWFLSCVDQYSTLIYQKYCFGVQHLYIIYSLMPLIPLIQTLVNKKSSSFPIIDVFK